MRAKIRKWGNSLGLRIPKAFAEETGIADGSTVTMTVEDDKLIVRRVRRPTFELGDLLAGIRPGNRHEEIATGDPTGHEVW